LDLPVPAVSTFPPVALLAGACARVVAAGRAASPILTRLADGTTNEYSFLAQALDAMPAASMTAEDPHCSPMHCATAVSQDDVSHRQESARQRQPSQEQTLARVHDCAFQTDWWQASSQVG